MKVQYLCKVVLIVGLLHAANVMAYPCGYSLGQRVVLIVNNPDHETLWSGMQGTIICFDEWTSWYPVIVSFDDWTDGGSYTWLCTTPILPFTAGSLWPLACDEISVLPEVPDLFDGGERYRYFQPQTLVAGRSNQQFEVGLQLRNGGEGDPQDAIYAKLYLSKDTEVTPQDYYLGYVSCYIGGGGSINLVWKRAFPTTIPAGIYYVGWIIDPDNLINDEYDESNNKACMTSYRLVVTTPAGQPCIEISAATGGTILNPGEGVFSYSTVKSLPITASPDPSCSFFAWAGTAVDAGKVADRFDPSTTVTVDARYTLTALFAGPHVDIDDFERFSDPCNVLSKVWIDGITFSEDRKGHSGNGTGAIVGNSELPSARNPTVHGGIQSMLFSYQNEVKPWYSETERTWGTLQNWKRTGASQLSLWHRGSPANMTQNLYVALRDCHEKVAVSANPDFDAVRKSEWTRWSIPFAEFERQGVMMSRITKLYIGAGDRNKPISGGHGTLYIDDITLEFEGSLEAK